MKKHKNNKTKKKKTQQKGERGRRYKPTGRTSIKYNWQKTKSNRKEHL